MEKFLVGMSEKIITPPGPIKLQGQFFTRVSEYVESDLTANVLAAEADGEQLILVSCDLVSISEELCEAVRRLVSDRTKEIDALKIILSATHTHTGPEVIEDAGLLDALKYLPEDSVYEDEGLKKPHTPFITCFNFIANQISEAILEAWNSRAAAFIAPWFGRAVTGHCRRAVYSDGTAKMYGNTSDTNFYRLESGNETGIELLYVYNNDKKPLGALVNVACPAQLVEGGSYVSSDYWGKAREYIKRALGSGFVTVGLLSAAGCQSPRDIIRAGKNNAESKSNGTKMIGRRVADCVTDGIDQAAKTAVQSAVLSHSVFCMDLPIRRVTAAECESALETISEYIKNKRTNIYNPQDMVMLHPPAGILERAKQQEKQIFYSPEIHVIRLGNIALATNTFELFLDYGNKIRARSPADQTFLIELACGCGMYLPTAEAEKGSHYSAYVSSGYVGHEAGNLLVEKTLEEIVKLWKEGN